MECRPRRAADDPLMQPTGMHRPKLRANEAAHHDDVHSQPPIYRTLPAPLRSMGPRRCAPPIPPQLNQFPDCSRPFPLILDSDGGTPASASSFLASLMRTSAAATCFCTAFTVTFISSATSRRDRF